MYVYLVGAFGINSMPAHFQFAMTQTLSRGDDPPQFTVFIDDVGTGGTTIEEAWKNTMKCLKRLSATGFPISITKCKFLEL